MNITKIDKNLAVEAVINKDDIKYYDVADGTFGLYGLYKPYGKKSFTRMPEEIADNVSEGVKHLNHIYTGARVRFITNSKYVAVSSEFLDASFAISSKSSLLSTTGMDLYIMENGKQRYYSSMIPPVEFKNYYEQIIEFCDESEREIILYLPKTNCATNMKIGFQEKAYIKKSGYKYEKPILYYGSSITQGGCATRGGNIYPSMVSRYFESDFVNLGFSGNCKGEDLMAEYIASCDMSIFVYDYDHNAPSADYLRETHEKLFKTFRKSHPDTPVIFMSKTDIPRTPGEYKAVENRKKVILDTYNNAINTGDKNVYYIDGQEIFKIAGGADCTMDGCHPNDLGFWCMAQAVIKVIEENKLL